MNLTNQIPDLQRFIGDDITEGDFKVAFAELLSSINEIAGSDSFVSGMIITWYGSSSNVPDGWAICDGGNGTPDLRNRFVIGAGSSYTKGATGGSSSVSISGNTGGTTLSVNQMPSHNHGYTYSYSNYDSGFAQGNGRDVRSSNKDTNNTGGGNSHAHSFSGSANVLPPYYALFYIMKL